MDNILGIVSLVIMLVTLFIVGLIVVGSMKVFDKAGKPAWAAFVPIYNVFVMFEICGFPGIYALGMFVPLVNVVLPFFLMIKLAESFGQGPLFGIGMVFFPFLFFPILGFGDAQYVGPSA